MEQLPFWFSMEEHEVDEKPVEPVRYVEVCDLPYFTEPEVFYEKRMREKMTVRVLRSYASDLFQKPEHELMVRDYKLAFLHRYPFVILIDGNNHEVTVKKYNGEWILSCNCGAWVYNRNGDRTCKHTEHMEKILEG